MDDNEKITPIAQHAKPAIADRRGVLNGSKGLNPVKVRVTNVAVEHEVRIMDFTKWLDRSGGSPREMAERKRNSVDSRDGETEWQTVIHFADDALFLPSSNLDSTTIQS